jgi:hypothetical protein
VPRAWAAAEAQHVGRPPVRTPSRSRDAADSDALERDRVRRWPQASLSRPEAHLNAVVCWGDLGQADLLMPNAIERRGVLAWLAQRHRVRPSIRMPWRAKLSQAS